MNFAVTQMGSSKTKTHSANFNGTWEKPLNYGFTAKIWGKLIYLLQTLYSNDRASLNSK